MRKFFIELESRLAVMYSLSMWCLYFLLGLSLC